MFIFASGMKMRSHCPINFGLEHFGDKWSLLILRDLAFKGKRHYNEFLEAGERVSTTVLRDKLILLEEGGLIIKEQDSVKKSRIRYSLTAKGIQLVPMLIEIILWSGQFDKNTDADKAFLQRGKTDREGLIKDIIRQLKKDHLSKSK